jgi:hypothetical protein
MAVWEYKVVSLGANPVFAPESGIPDKEKRIEDTLNTLGKDGWELVAITHESPILESGIVIAYLKRRKN